ncbi:MAG TPA: TRAP transporter substrate-binding protein DctP [Polyangiaceae bacterium]|nr:TRAP transporter substrate-binding protein DctP [Polyangiaceae bacterium]
MKLTHRLLAALAICSSVTAVSAASAAEHTLRIATIAPKASSWGKVYGAWQKAIEKKTDGKLELQIYFNGVQGNEDAMVSKIKTGQLDGAAITAVGLSLIYKSVLVLQLPGVLTSWDQLDKVRAQIQPSLDAGIKAAGFNIVGWGDVGLVRQFTKGFEIHHPDDVKNKRPAVWRNEPTGPALYATIGNVVPVPVDAMEMLPMLRSGNVNVIAAPALAAEQLQWTPYLDHVNDNVIVCALGGLIFKAGVLESLPADMKATWDELEKRATASQQGRIRKLDDEAYSRIQQKMTLVKLTQAEHDEWEKLLRRVVKQLARGTYDKTLVNKVLTMRGYEPVD